MKLVGHHIHLLQPSEGKNKQGTAFILDGDERENVGAGWGGGCVASFACLSGRFNFGDFN